MSFLKSLKICMRGSIDLAVGVLSAAPRQNNIVFSR